jgi:hypothetical protein
VLDCLCLLHGLCNRVEMFFTAPLVHLSPPADLLRLCIHSDFLLIVSQLQMCLLLVARFISCCCCLAGGLLLGTRLVG